MRIALSFIVLLSVSALAQTPATRDADPLFDAAREGDRSRVVALLEAGTDVNAQTPYGVTALGFGFPAGHTYPIARTTDDPSRTAGHRDRPWRR